LAFSWITVIVIGAIEIFIIKKTLTLSVRTFKWTYFLIDIVIITIFLVVGSIRKWDLASWFDIT
jgi:hypothetical protein